MKTIPTLDKWTSASGSIRISNVVEHGLFWKRNDYLKEIEHDAATWTSILVSTKTSYENNQRKQRPRKAKVVFVMDGNLEYVYYVEKTLKPGIEEFWKCREMQIPCVAYMRGSM